MVTKVYLVYNSYHMVTKETQPSNVIKIKTSSIALQINKSTWKKHSPRQNTDLYIRDTKLTGYYIRIRPNGKKTYNCSARLGGVGSKKYITIGDCNLLTQDEARETARQYLNLLKQGTHPKLKIRKEAGKNKTLNDLVEEYLSSNKFLKESSRKDYRTRIKNCMPSLWKKPIVEIQTEDVEDWWSRSNGSRNNQIAFGYARKLMSRATASRYIDRNPFNDAKELIGDFPPPVRKTNHISKTQLWKFFNAFKEIGERITPTMRDFFVFLLVTGKRSEEVRTLSWNNVDFKNGTITLEKTKNNKVDVIPMTDFMYVMLKHREKTKHPLWVFQNRTGDGYIKDSRKSLKKISDKADLGFHITPHDFRRTFSTALGELKISNEEIAILLNHSKRDVTEGYIFRTLEYKQNNLEQLEKYFNDYGEQFLNYICVYWYEGNSNIFSPEFIDNSMRSNLDKEKEREYLLGVNEDKYEGLGHPEYKEPKKTL